jgi:hypothetical protein
LFIAYAFYAQRPNVNEIFLSGDFSHVGGLAGFIGHDLAA